MKLKEGLLNYNDVTPGDVYIFTANSMLNKHGRLCMGGGAAYAACLAYMGIDLILGEEIKKHIFDQIFGYVQVPFNIAGIGEFEVGAFQTKTVVWEPSTLELIELATHGLSKIASKSDKTFHLNFPGIGLGGLESEDVSPIIEVLPDNVIVYK